MENRIKEAFSSKGLFLDKKISIHFQLQKGSEGEKKLGSFALDMEGCSNIARKSVLICAVATLFLLGSLRFYKKIKIFSKST